MRLQSSRSIECNISYEEPKSSYDKTLLSPFQEIRPSTEEILANSPQFGKKAEKKSSSKEVRVVSYSHEDSSTDFPVSSN